MRISSDFKDYYDVGMSWGQDRTLVYSRFRSKKPLCIHLADNSERYASEFVIGFCGKIYAGFRTTYHVPGEFHCREVFSYSIEDLDRYVEKHGSSEERALYASKSRWYMRYRGFPSRNAAIKFFSHHKEREDSHFDQFIEYKTPIFLNLSKNLSDDGKPCTIINGCLADFNFQKIFDPVLAYQEVSMFVGMLGMPEKDIPEVSDEDLIEAKGFDKWSFRKEPKRKKSG